MMGWVRWREGVCCHTHTHTHTHTLTHTGEGSVSNWRGFEARTMILSEICEAMV